MLEWRGLCSGISANGTAVPKMSSRAAACVVDVPKKSLDHYLLLIKAGSRYGYNFNEHKDKKMGHLSSFVKWAKRQKYM